jgi:hypothetical protein
MQSNLLGVEALDVIYGGTRQSHTDKASSVYTSRFEGRGKHEEEDFTFESFRGTFRQKESCII